MGEIQNPIPEKDAGQYRKDKDRVIPVTLAEFHHDLSIQGDDEFHNGICFCPKAGKSLTFPEAGPRKSVFFPNITIENPKDTFNVAIIVSGGIAPGINAVIDGITSRHYLYLHEYNKIAKKQNHGKPDEDEIDESIPENRLNILGFNNGFRSLYENINDHYYLVPDENTKVTEDAHKLVTSSKVNIGGSMIGTSRYQDLIDLSKRTKIIETIVSNLKAKHIRILYIIGGDGSMKAAHAISYIAEKEFKDDSWDLTVVGIPKTMDNDILWVWQTFGFMSTVEKAREFIDYLAVEVESNPRIGIVQLFGSNSGFVVSHAVLASRSNICDAALIPEIDFSLDELKKYIKQKAKKLTKKHGLIIMAETAIPFNLKADEVDTFNFLNDEEKKALKDFIKSNRKFEGQTDDYLRTAGVKLVYHSIKEIKDNKNEQMFRLLLNEPRHLIRAIPPSTLDIIFASRLGTLAVDNAMAGFNDFMISQWLTEYVLVPLKLVVLGRKRIPQKGIFWKSVKAKTGQPDLIGK
jgi:6-phosphofructokinase 1